MSTNPAARRPDRTWLYVALAFMAAWGVYLAFFNPMRSGPSGLGASGLTMPAEYGWRLLDLDGSPVEFSRFKGKTVFLNVWATWCPPCVAEMPSIAKLASDPRMKDVAFVCVSVDDTPDVVKTFLRGKNWPMTVLRATDTPPVFATDGIPATFMIAPDGRVAAAEVGSTNWDDPKVKTFLEGLAAAK